MKYVMLEVIRDGIPQEVPVIFPSQLVHSDMAELMKSIEGMASANVLSAGECRVKVSCSGNSPTLEVESRREKDDFTINSYDYLHGHMENSDILPPSVLALLSNQ